MAVYAVGDIQGCYHSLRRLLDKVDFDPAHDQLWCAGDLVNRGPDSLAVLRYLSSLGNAATCVLGNHDIHLLEKAAGGRRSVRGDTLEPVLNAPDAESLLDWLRFRPLLHHDELLDMVMVHAGLAPDWSLKKAKKRAASIEKRLRRDDWAATCGQWADCQFPEADPGKADKQGRLLYSLGVFTCSRFCNEQGNFNWAANRTTSNRAGDQPWYLHRKLRWRKDVSRVIFGHWAAMGLVREYPHVLGLDSGCVWGGKLTLARLDQQPMMFKAVDCGCQR